MRAFLMRTFAKIRVLFLSRHADEDLQREITAHLALLEEEFERRGLSADEARLAARRKLGGVDQAKQAYRDERSIQWLEQAHQSLRHAFRRLRRSPGFTLTAIVTLALGIGATTAAFSLIDGVLLRPLPFRQPNRLVLLGDHLGKGLDIGVTAREIGQYSRATRAFSSLGAYAPHTYELSGGAAPETIYGGRLGASVFPTLGVQPILGRVFTQQEEDARQPVAVLSYSLWTDRYRRSTHITGGAIELGGKTYTIIGVMPRSFEFPMQAGSFEQAQLWVPLRLTTAELSKAETGHWGYHMVARLKDGMSLAKAAQDVDRVSQQIMRNFPPGLSAIHIRGDVIRLNKHTVATVRPLLRMLFLGVSIFLLIACLNVAVLLLVRAMRSRREYAVRLALGAKFRVIFGESLFEGLILSIFGGALGVLFAALAIRTALRLAPPFLPRVDSVSMNATVILFALLLAAVTGVVCSLVPALAAAQTSLLESLKESSPAGTQSKSYASLRSVMVILEIAIALTLLIASGAFLGSYEKMLAVDPGFRPEHVLIASYQLHSQQYPTNSRIDGFNRAVVDGLSNQPGVLDVGIATALPVSGGSAASGYTLQGEPVSKWKLKFANFAITYGHYFRAMGIPLIAGRYFTGNDGPDSPPVVIVNRSMARHCWPGQNAIGKQFHAGNPSRNYPWATVVGIVADTKPGSLDQPGADQWYAPADQPATLNGYSDTRNRTLPAGGYLTVRVAGSPTQMIHTLRSVVASIDPTLALNQVQTMENAISKVEAPRRFNTVFIAVFTICALALAITGIYAVVAFSVSLRSQEIAIRMALGARRVSIARLVLWSGVKLALAGCSVGVIGSLALSRLIRTFLFGVSATDPSIYAGSVLLIVLVAALASIRPAARAASAQPLDALRVN